MSIFNNKHRNNYASRCITAILSFLFVGCAVFRVNSEYQNIKSGNRLEPAISLCLDIKFMKMHAAASTYYSEEFIRKITDDISMQTNLKLLPCNINDSQNSRLVIKVLISQNYGTVESLWDARYLLTIISFGLIPYWSDTDIEIITTGYRNGNSMSEFEIVHRFKEYYVAHLFVAPIGLFEYLTNNTAISKFLVEKISLDLKEILIN